MQSTEKHLGHTQDGDNLDPRYTKIHNIITQINEASIYSSKSKSTCELCPTNINTIINTYRNIRKAHNIIHHINQYKDEGNELSPSQEDLYHHIQNWMTQQWDHITTAVHNWSLESTPTAPLCKDFFQILSTSENSTNNFQYISPLQDEFSDLRWYIPLKCNSVCHLEGLSKDPPFFYECSVRTEAPSHRQTSFHAKPDGGGALEKGHETQEHLLSTNEAPETLDRTTQKENVSEKHLASFEDGFLEAVIVREEHKSKDGAATAGASGSQQRKAKRQNRDGEKMGEDELESPPTSNCSVNGSCSQEESEDVELRTTAGGEDLDLDDEIRTQEENLEEEEAGMKGSNESLTTGSAAWKHFNDAELSVIEEVNEEESTPEAHKYSTIPSKTNLHPQDTGTIVDDNEGNIEEQPESPLAASGDLTIKKEGVVDEGGSAATENISINSKDGEDTGVERIVSSNIVRSDKGGEDDDRDKMENERDATKEEEKENSNRETITKTEEELNKKGESIPGNEVNQADTTLSQGAPTFEEKGEMPPVSENVSSSRRNREQEIEGEQGFMESLAEDKNTRLISDRLGNPTEEDSLEVLLRQEGNLDDKSKENKTEESEQLNGLNGSTPTGETEKTQSLSTGKKIDNESNDDMDDQAMVEELLKSFNNNEQTPSDVGERPTEENPLLNNAFEFNDNQVSPSIVFLQVMDSVATNKVAVNVGYSHNKPLASIDNNRQREAKIRPYNSKSVEDSTLQASALNIGHSMSYHPPSIPAPDRRDEMNGFAPRHTNILNENETKHNMPRLTSGIKSLTSLNSATTSQGNHSDRSQLTATSLSHLTAAPIAPKENVNNALAPKNYKKGRAPSWLMLSTSVAPLGQRKKPRLVLMSTTLFPTFFLSFQSYNKGVSLTEKRKSLSPFLISPKKYKTTLIHHLPGSVPIFRNDGTTHFALMNTPKYFFGSDPFSSEVIVPLASHLGCSTPSCKSDSLLHYTGWHRKGNDVSNHLHPSQSQEYLLITEDVTSSSFEIIEEMKKCPKEAFALIYILDEEYHPSGCQCFSQGEREKPVLDDYRALDCTALIEGGGLNGMSATSRKAAKKLIRYWSSLGAIERGNGVSEAVNEYCSASFCQKEMFSLQEKRSRDARRSVGLLNNVKPAPLSLLFSKDKGLLEKEENQSKVLSQINFDKTREKLNVAHPSCLLQNEKEFETPSVTPAHSPKIKDSSKFKKAILASLELDKETPVENEKKINLEEKNDKNQGISSQKLNADDPQEFCTLDDVFALVRDKEFREMLKDILWESSIGRLRLERDILHESICPCEKTLRLGEHDVHREEYLTSLRDISVSPSSLPPNHSCLSGFSLRLLTVQQALSGRSNLLPPHMVANTLLQKESDLGCTFLDVSRFLANKNNVNNLYNLFVTLLWDIRDAHKETLVTKDVNASHDVISHPPQQSSSSSSLEGLLDSSVFAAYSSICSHFCSSMTEKEALTTLLLPYESIDAWIDELMEDSNDVWVTLKAKLTGAAFDLLNNHSCFPGNGRGTPQREHCQNVKIAFDVIALLVSAKQQLP